jgi:hypothetical protein
MKYELTLEHYGRSQPGWWPSMRLLASLARLGAALGPQGLGTAAKPIAESSDIADVDTVRDKAMATYYGLAP